MRAHESGWMFEMLMLALQALALRRRAVGEQTGGRRFGLLRCDVRERTRCGRLMPSERACGRGPPGMGVVCG